MAKFTCNFISYTLHRTVDITVVIPSVTIPESMGMGASDIDGVPDDLAVLKGNKRHTKDHKYPVLYLFHGYGNNHAQWTGYTNVELFAEERNIAIVNISAENKSYVKNGGDDFYSFIEDELPDFICGMFPVSDRPEDTYVAGLSMGGYGTLVHALSRPEKYAAFGAFSAAVDINPASLSGGEGADKPVDPSISPLALADKLIADGTPFPKAYIAIGGKDFLLDANRAFRDKLTNAGIEVTYEEIPEYGHEWRFWNIEVERFLDWIQPIRTDAYAKAGKRQV
ncbi:MAG: alpha/beta hydrolase fold domain-containing protein [Lachnospiraceae bacterium]|nr:alpha/beta hydrolase fold domain-containing protein [Lachnospiraceae bacterium]